MTKRLFLLPCVSQKLPVPAKAKRLYVSPLFKKMKRIVENANADWWILSAKYGLVFPNDVIEPYELTLNDAGSLARQAWAQGVVESMLRRMRKDMDEVIVFAGLNYREYLMCYLRNVYPWVDVPMEGLPIGKQLEWLDAHQDFYTEKYEFKLNGG